MLKLFSFAVLLGGLSEICAEHSIVKKSGHSGPPYPLWHLEPLYVKALPAKTEEKRETPGGGESQSQVEETHAVLTDIDGQRTGVQQQIQKVSKNGKLISKVFQQEHGAAGRGQAPHFQKLTKIDLPELDVHQQFFDDGEEAGAGAGARVNHVKRNAGGSAPVRLPSAEEMAQYILLTGDQASVVNLIEGLVNNGKMSEEQALVYVETIKALLESVEKDEEEEEIREMLIQRKLQEAEREDALRNLLRRAPQDKEDNLYRQLRGGW